MKWLFFLLILTIGGFFTYQRMVSASISLMNECLLQAKIELETSGRSQQGLCLVNEQALDRLSICLSSVQKQKFMAGLLFGPTGIEDRVAVMVTSHNELCPGNDVPMPTAEMYINN